jgi:transposase
VIAIGRQNWLFAGSLRGGKRAAAGMSLIHSAKLNGLDPYVYMKDVLERLPTQPASRIKELLPHAWNKTRQMITLARMDSLAKAPLQACS